MARRRSKMSRNRRIGPGHNEANRQTRESRGRAKMLHQGREAHFRFDVEELLVADGIPQEEWRPFLQTLWTQGSRLGLDECLDWLMEQMKEGRIDADLQQSIARLVKKYSTYR